MAVRQGKASFHCANESSLLQHDLVRTSHTISMLLQLTRRMLRTSVASNYILKGKEDSYSRCTWLINFLGSGHWWQSQQLSSITNSPEGMMASHLLELLQFFRYCCLYVAAAEGVQGMRHSNDEGTVILPSQDVVLLGREPASIHVPTHLLTLPCMMAHSRLWNLVGSVNLDDLSVFWPKFTDNLRVI